MGSVPVCKFIPMNAKRKLSISCLDTLASMLASQVYCVAITIVEPFVEPPPTHVLVSTVDLGGVTVLVVCAKGSPTVYSNFHKLGGQVGRGSVRGGGVWV